MTGTEFESNEDLVGEAEDLIGTGALWRGQIIYAGVKLGMFGVLTDEFSAAPTVAEELGLDQDRTYRLLRALSHFDLLEEDDDRRFSITPLGKLFREDHPNSVQSDVLFNRSPEWIRSMLHLPEIVIDGGPSGFVREFGTEFFEYTAENPKFGTVYDDLMELASRNHPEKILNALDEYDFSRFSSVCDVGGGRGYFLGHLLKEVSHLEGIVFDLPRVIVSEDRHWASELGVADRCSYTGGDMFDHVPSAGLYCLKWILHNWDDDDCQRILSTVRESGPAHSHLFVIETLVPGPGKPHYAKRLDVTMMTQVGGRERSVEEYRELLNRAGWVLEDVWATEDSPINVLEAVQA